LLGFRPSRREEFRTSGALGWRVAEQIGYATE
jgi:hypothetical protein